MPFVSIALLFATTLSGQGQCAYDQNAMLLLDQNAFDQDMDGGWRTLAANGCDAQAADLIAKWREVHHAEDPILYWHEGQLRANAGEYDRAVRLFEAARHPASEDEKWGWNLYVEGSIAFLEGDLPALESARAKLSMLPEPPEFQSIKDVHGNLATIAWPMNLHVLDGFIRCWGKRYKEAYNCPN